MTAPDPIDAYRATRQRVTELVRHLPEDTLDRTAPATPRWRLRDIVAHLAGTTSDIVVGRLEGVATDEWTQAQVEARRHLPLAQVLDEWARCSATVEPTIPQFPSMMRTMFITDVVTHEHDLRGALGEPGARDSDAIALSFRALSRGIGARRDDVGAGPLRIVHDAGETTVGGGAEEGGTPTATLHANRFEIVRAGVGRRAPGQIAAWSWEGDARPETVVVAMFNPPRVDPLDE
jgi:uncharacterized protein (TIGR03083 family)